MTLSIVAVTDLHSFAHFIPIPGFCVHLNEIFIPVCLLLFSAALSFYCFILFFFLLSSIIVSCAAGYGSQRHRSPRAETRARTGKPLEEVRGRISLHVILRFFHRPTLRPLTPFLHFLSLKHFLFLPFLCSN